MAKPVVDGLERKWKGKLEVAHVDVNDDKSAELTAKYGISAIPAFILLDGDGRVLYRQVGGKPDVSKIDALMASAKP